MDERAGDDGSARATDLELLGTDQHETELGDVVDDHVVGEEEDPGGDFDDLDADFEDQDGEIDDEDGDPEDRNEDRTGDETGHVRAGHYEDDETEADLAALLSARLGTDNNDDEEEHDDGEVKAKQSSTHSLPSVVEHDDDFAVHPRRYDEWVCTNCFLIVNKASAAAVTCPHCGVERDAPIAK